MLARGRDENDASPEAESALTNRILILEEDLDVRTVLTGCLLELGYDVTCTGSAMESIRFVSDALFERAPFRAMILDLSPRSGAESMNAFASIRRLHGELPVIATSTSADSIWLVDYRAHGFAAALAKPWGFVDLAMALKRAIDRGTPRRAESSIRRRIV